MRHILQLLLLSILVISVCAGSDIEFQCQQCGDFACLLVTGGPFENGYTYESEDSSCPAGFPVSFQFQCDTGECSDCQITYYEQGEQSNVACSDSEIGQYTIEVMDAYYSAQQGSTSQLSYDWCGCPGLSTGAIVGIVIGSIVGAAAIGGLIWYCFCRKKSFDNYTTK